MDYTVLKAEIANDPDGLGYKQGGNWKGDDVVADLLNNVSASYQIQRQTIPMGEVYGQVDWDGEFLALSAAQKEAFKVITSTEFLDASSQHIRDAFQAIFGPGTTLTGLQGLIIRDGSRAEALFGEGVVVTPSDIGRAANA